ncbi:MAG TPA: MraY family glycosyltransferase, partial [Candidatus Hydrogenedentes bacterium]|nr:MraY family glycosyltransferase [Candidatus Hydrogenedentota bacterium]
MLDTLHYWPRTYIMTGCVSFVLAAILTPVAIALLKRWGVMDAVSENKIHSHPVPRAGGIVIFIAFAVGVLLPNYRDNPMKGIMLGAGMCLLVGAIDDWRGGIPAVFKFITLLFVTYVMSLFDVQLRIFNSYWLDLLLTMIWVVGVTSSFNGIDNMDGLASGVATIVSTMYLVIALQAFFFAGTETPLSWFGLLAAGLIG